MLSGEITLKNSHYHFYYYEENTKLFLALFPCVQCYRTFLRVTRRPVDNARQSTPVGSETITFISDSLTERNNTRNRQEGEAFNVKIIVLSRKHVNVWCMFLLSILLHTNTHMNAQ